MQPARAASWRSPGRLPSNTRQKGIRANSILPGHINTPMVHVDNPGHPGGVEGFIKERDKWVPMGRMGEAWDVANAALFLASDEAAYITGAELIVDGGLTAATAW